jgi:hypothetical protein
LLILPQIKPAPQPKDDTFCPTFPLFAIDKYGTTRSHSKKDAGDRESILVPSLSTPVMFSDL